MIFKSLSTAFIKMSSLTCEHMNFVQCSNVPTDLFSSVFLEKKRQERLQKAEIWGD